jgi:TRAP-type mannitol/chloroaromatic compound transport system substrate-binding protein
MGRILRRPRLLTLTVTALALTGAAAMSGSAASASSDPDMGRLYTGTGSAGLCQANPAAASPEGFFTVVPQADGTVQVNLHLRDATPNATYNVADTCHYFVSGLTFTTNKYGVGNVSFTVPAAGQTTWVFDGYNVSGQSAPTDHFVSTPVTPSS